MSVMEWIAYWLLVIGGVNWGIYGVSRLLKNPFDLVTAIFGFAPWLGNVVFVLVGVSGIVAFYTGIKLLMK